MTKTISIGFGLFALLLASLLVIPLLIDVNRWKPEIEAAASKALGRQLHIDGGMSVIILPYPGLTMSSVRLGNASWSSQKEMLTIDAMTLSVSLLHLITKTLQFSQITLIKPNALVEFNKGGQNNWDFITKAVTGAASGGSDKMTLGGWTVDTNMPKLSIRNGSLTYVEGSQTQKITEFEALLKADSKAGPYTLEGGLSLNNHEIEYNARIGAFSSGKPLSLDMNVDTEGQRIELLGNLDIQGKEFKGQLASKLNTFGIADGLSPFQGYMTVTADMNIKPASFDLTNLTFTNRDLKAVGHIHLDLGKAAAFEARLDGIPGDTSFSLSGPLAKLGQFSGKLAMNSENLPALIKWLDPSIATTKGMDHLQLNADYIVREGNVKINNLDLSLDEKKVTGSVDAQMPEIKLSLATPQLGSWLSLMHPQGEEQQIGPASLEGSFRVGEEVSLKSQLKFAKGSLNANGNLSPSAKKYNLDLDVTYPNFNELLTALGMEMSKLNFGSLQAKMKVAGDSSKITLSGLSGSLNPGKSPLTFKGEATIDLVGTKPKLAGQVTLGQLMLKDMLAQSKTQTDRPRIMLASLKTPQNDNSSEWSKTDLNLTFLNKLDADLDVRTDKLVLSNLTIDGLQMLIRLNNGTLTAEKVTGNAQGGTFEGALSLSSADTHQTRLSLDIKNATLSNQLGTLDVDLTVSSTGKSMHDLVSHMQGNVNLQARNVKIEGFDAADFEKRVNSRQFLDIANLIVTQTKGSTLFNSIIAKGLIDKGVLAIQTIQLQGPNLQGQGLGTVDLLQQILDLSTVLTFKNIPAAPAFKVIMTGSIYQPKKGVEAADLTAFLVKNSGKKAIQRVIENGIAATNPKELVNPKGLLKGLLN